MPRVKIKVMKLDFRVSYKKKLHLYWAFQVSAGQGPLQCIQCKCAGYSAAGYGTLLQCFSPRAKPRFSLLGCSHSSGVILRFDILKGVRSGKGLSSLHRKFLSSCIWNGIFYTVSGKKGATLFLPVTLRNANQFSKFFYSVVNLQ